MELKQFFGLSSGQFGILLIVPYGIETTHLAELTYQLITF